VPFGFAFIMLSARLPRYVEVVRARHAHPPRVASATYVQVIRRLHIQGSMQSPQIFAIVPAPSPVVQLSPARPIRPAAAA
ncbi:unnamed protein product, partial [Symbiodinium sp. KB8]